MSLAGWLIVQGVVLVGLGILVAFVPAILVALVSGALILSGAAAIFIGIKARARGHARTRLSQVWRRESPDWSMWHRPDWSVWRREEFEAMPIGVVRAWWSVWSR